MDVNDNESTETIETTSDVVNDKETITKKDPKKVEQGKRLASISRAAKEKKMREKIENEMRNESYTSKIPRSLLVGLPLLTVYFLYSRYNKRSDEPVEIKSEANVVSEAKPVPPEEEIKKVKKFETVE